MDKAVQRQLASGNLTETIHERCQSSLDSMMLELATFQHLLSICVDKLVQRQLLGGALGTTV